jgi:flavorubredoxin
MTRELKAVKVADRVYWVGAIDWEIRNFHGYLTSRGTTYNAFLVLADKVTLIDTVKAPFYDELMARISSVIDPAKIDYIVSNHSEMDHTGCLPRVAAAVKPEKVFASRQGLSALGEHFGAGLEVVAVNDGQVLDLGSDKLSFFETRMCHWPDSMVSYLHGPGVLFSQDAFGMHLASSERFDDELGALPLEHELAKYYANILMPLAAPIKKALAKLTGSGLDFKLVCPDHGPIWRRNFPRVLELYERWSGSRRTRKAVVVYDTMWQSTRKMAEAVRDGLAGGGATAVVMPLESSHRSDVATEVLEAAALIVGSPTINNQVFPTVADVMCYLQGLRPAGLIGAAFGSYGWSGEATKLLSGMLDAMKVEQVAEPVRAKYVPSPEDLSACRELGAKVARRLAEAYPERFATPPP